jgi:putative sterol carrier protein
LAILKGLPKKKREESRVSKAKEKDAKFQISTTKKGCSCEQPFYFGIAIS